MILPDRGTAVFAVKANKEIRATILQVIFLFMIICILFLMLM
jgi:hypothetical protein